MTTHRPSTPATEALLRILTVVALTAIVIGVASFALNLAPGLLGSPVLRGVTIASVAIGLPCVLVAMRLNAKFVHPADSAS